MGAKLGVSLETFEAENPYTHARTYAHTHTHICISYINSAPTSQSSQPLPIRGQLVNAL